MIEVMDYTGYVFFDPFVQLVGSGAPAKESQREQYSLEFHCWTSCVITMLLTAVLKSSV